MSSTKDPTSATVEALIKEAESLGMQGTEQVRTALQTHKGQPLKKSLGMRNEIDQFGISPAHQIMRLALKAEKAADEREKEQLRGKEDSGDRYLAVAGNLWKVIADKYYPSMKAISISLDDDTKAAFDATNPQHVLRAIVSDPFFTNEQREALIKELQIKDVTPTEALPIGTQNKEEK